MIDLSLARVSSLLKYLGSPQNSFKSIHIAGTNGKGSVSAYVSSCLKQAGNNVARFNSPHLVDEWDCVSINEKTVDKALFKETQRFVNNCNEKQKLSCTEFELLTATAFKIFEETNAQVGVVEVGLGGRLDATNVLQDSNVLVSIITKIGLDHQGFLGDTIEQIAKEKAGICKKHVPVVVDSTNQPSVLSAIASVATATDSPLIQSVQPERLQASPASELFAIDPAITPLLGSYQRANIATALTALSLLPQKYNITKDAVEQGIKNTLWPGRLQYVGPFLLDGAHNYQAAVLLDEFVQSNVRNARNTSVTWVLAFSEGKDVSGIIETLVKPSDTVIATEFGPVNGMPWVKSLAAEKISEIVASKTTNSCIVQKDIAQALQASKNTDQQPIIAGSLYLVAAVLRLIREQGSNIVC